MIINHGDDQEIWDSFYAYKVSKRVAQQYLQISYCGERIELMKWLETYQNSFRISEICNLPTSISSMILDYNGPNNFDHYISKIVNHRKKSFRKFISQDLNNYLLKENMCFIPHRIISWMDWQSTLSFNILSRIKHSPNNLYCRVSDLPNLMSRSRVF
jgi:hypothetical protein